MSAAEQLEPRDISAEVHRRLKFWALWRFVEDDPGVGYPRINILRRHGKPGLGDVWEQSTVTDWAEAILTDDAVKTLRGVAPMCYHAIMARYRYTEEVFDSKAEREKDQLRRFSLSVGRDMSGSRFRALIAQARQMLAMRLAK